MKKITPDQIRDRIIEVDLNSAQVQRALGYSVSWFQKMLMQNDHKFHEPNPDRMKKIMRFLNAYEKFKAGWQ